MRSRSNSGIRLDHYYRIINQTVIKYQNPITGLIAFSDENQDAWVRDNVYSVLSVWALSLAYRKNADADEERVKAYELEQRVVKLMRGLLVCMMRQVEKVEKFKHTSAPGDSLHAKYSSYTCSSVVSDNAWGHLQIDATSLFLLMLAQMTTSGLQIIFTLDEVAFVQNLIFYIESAYRIPDYGIWERGDKTNHGLPELNASSIGLAKAAMEAMAERDLFGSCGGPLSRIHVQADKVAQCNAILQSMLPRESNSKEIDSALLSVIGFPAFAVDDAGLVEKTREKILDKLLGRYGCSRFLRDGYKTVLEDPNRLHYEPWELQKFEGIECEWPVFLAYLSINESFEGHKEQASHYLEKLSQVLIAPKAGHMKVVPEMYAVPADKVKDELANPRSQERKPIGQIPHKWGQSLYVVSCLLSEGFISPSELDPLNRRHAVLPKPDLVVQIVILAEDDSIKNCLVQADIKCSTIDSLQEDEKYVLHPANVLAETFGHLGECPRLGLTGRYAGVGLLGTSTLYRYGDKIHCFTPELYDYTKFYLAMDTDFLIDQIRTDLAYLKNNWQSLGRPTLILPIYQWMADFSGEVPFEFKRLFLKLISGYLNGVQVQVGSLDDFISTSCIAPIDWLEAIVDENEVSKMLERTYPQEYRPRLPSGTIDASLKRESLMNSNPLISGIVKRSMSIPIDQPATPPKQPTFIIGGKKRNGSPDTKKPYNMDYPDALKLVSSKAQLNVPTTSYLKVSTSSTHFPSNLPGSKADFRKQSGSELVKILKSTDDDHEQADILYFLYIMKGPDWETSISDDANDKCTVRDLLAELYHKAGEMKQWWLIRYAAAMLRKRVGSLASALSDLLVRQKHVTFGLPSQKEYIITQPLAPEEIVSKIEAVCASEPLKNLAEPPKFCANSPLCMLHQELLIYLAMFVRTEPELFHEILRIRIGLIIAVMTTELSRCLNCPGDEATVHLLNLSPYEIKNLLYHILSGREFTIQEVDDQYAIKSRADSQLSTRARSIKHRVSTPGLQNLELSSIKLDGDSPDESTDEAVISGQWARRRRIDGALNRVPVGFYSKVWHLLERCQGLSIEGKILSPCLIKEMTPGELKFALQVESSLNHVPEPEYRQLIVEAITTLSIFCDIDPKHTVLHTVIPVNAIVEQAYHIYLQDHDMTAASKNHSCPKLRGICESFYDMAPSGKCGSMTYMCRAIPKVIALPCVDGTDSVECIIQ